jgi:hypothetical protein
VKVLGRESVVRYHVEFTDEETDALQAISFLPPNCARPARLWSTGPELIETIAFLYGQERAAQWVESLKRGRARSRGE